MFLQHVQLWREGHVLKFLPDVYHELFDVILWKQNKYYANILSTNINNMPLVGFWVHYVLKELFKIR